MVAPPHGRRGRAFVIGSCVGAVGTGKREGCADPCPTGLCFAAIQPSDERCLWLGVLQGGRRRAHEYRPAGKGSRHIAAAPADEPASGGGLCQSRNESRSETRRGGKELVSTG